MRTKTILFALGLAVFGVLAADGPVNQAAARVHSLSNSHVSGLVTFTKTDKGVLVVAEIDGLTPGKHGFHIHEHGDCGHSDGNSAGGHFNPTNSKHGAPTDKDRHVGDLGNLVADAKGHAHYEWTDTLLELNGTNSIIGRSVIIHEKEDDFVTQPTGNAGGRIGCGKIEVVK